jgi:hypothetical protein
MGKEEASIPGVAAAAVFAFLGSLGHFMLPDSHEVAWLCLFICSFATFFASVKSPEKAD